MIWNYSLSTNTIWTSFDCGQIEADTYEEACALALKELKYNVDKANTVFKHCDITQGFTIDMDYTQLEVKLADPQPLPDNPPKPEPQAIREFALSCELIREQVEINESELLYDIYASEVTGLIYAVSYVSTDPLFIYKLIKPQAEIEIMHRDEILDYCLGKKTPEDEVSLGDIFVHGKYIQLITEV